MNRTQLELAALFALSLALAACGNDEHAPQPLPAPQAALPAVPAAPAIPAVETLPAPAPEQAPAPLAQSSPLPAAVPAQPAVPVASTPAPPLGLHSGAELCQAAFLRSFMIGNDSSESQAADGRGEGEFCTAPVVSITREAELAILQVGELNRKAAAYLGVEPSKLFGEGVRVKVIRDTAGVMASYFRRDNNRVYLGAFGDWRGEPLNDGVYVHELGHALANDARGVLPSVLHQLNSTHLIVEAFADLMAIGVSGKVITDSLELPACLGRARIIGKYTTFNYPADFFLSGYSTRKFVSCCDLLDQKGQQDLNSKMFCTDVRLRNRASDFSPLDRRTQFDPADYAAHMDRYDPHQLGIPLNGFFRAVKSELGLEPGRLFMEALARVSGSNEKSSFLCHHAKMLSLIADREVQAPSMELVLQSLRAAIPTGLRDGFEKLWAKHAMEQAIQVARADAGSSPAVNAWYEQVIEGLLERAKKRDPLLLQNECFIEKDMIDGLKEGCRPVCTPVLKAQPAGARK